MLYRILQLNVFEILFSAVGQTAIVSVWMNNLQLGCSENLQRKQLLDYDLLTATMIWTNSDVGPWNPDQIQYGLKPDSMVFTLAFLCFHLSDFSPPFNLFNSFQYKKSKRKKNQNDTKTNFLFR
jgi:hypothetical protein